MRVLVFDKDRSQLKAAKAQLQHTGQIVTITDDVNEALTYLEFGHFDAVLCEMFDMPKIKDPGLSVIQKLQEVIPYGISVYQGALERGVPYVGMFISSPEHAHETVSDHLRMVCEAFTKNLGMSSKMTGPVTMVVNANDYIGVAHKDRFGIVSPVSQIETGETQEHKQLGAVWRKGTASDKPYEQLGRISKTASAHKETDPGHDYTLVKNWGVLLQQLISDTELGLFPSV